MQKLSKMESFKGFQMTKQSMTQVSGSRTKRFESNGGSGDEHACSKVIDDNSGAETFRKWKERYNDKC